MKKRKITTATLKYRALELRRNYQIPFYLVYLINQLDGTEETKYIQYLSEVALHTMRTKNYYRLFPDMEKEAEQSIKIGLSKLGFTVFDINAK